MTKQEREVPLIAWLEKARDGDERRRREVFAILRRGVAGEAMGQAEMLRFVAPFFSEKTTRQQEDVLLLIAALFAWHSAPGGTGCMGDSFRMIAERTDDESAIERRFSILLAADAEDLPTHLRHAVSYLRSKEVPVNWHQLYYDVLFWRSGDGHIQRRWAKAYWSRVKQGDDQQQLGASIEAAQPVESDAAS